MQEKSAQSKIQSQLKVNHLEVNSLGVDVLQTQAQGAIQSNSSLECSDEHSVNVEVIPANELHELNLNGSGLNGLSELSVAETNLGGTRNGFQDMQHGKQRSTQKSTLYISHDLHRRLRIRSAIDGESMSKLVERAVAFYLAHSEIVDANQVYGRTHQVYACPECASELVLREGELVSLAQVVNFKAQGSGVGVNSSILPDGEGESVFPGQQEQLVCR